MNLPNKLTLSRAIATPVFMTILITNKIPFNYTIALIIFILASVTDLLDGKIARSYNLVTNFGKFLDPVADKMLTTAAMLGLAMIMPTRGLMVQMTVINFITLFREFTVSSVRVVALLSKEKKVIPANIWGKLKTVVQMAGIIVGILAYAIKEITPAIGNGFDIMVMIAVAICWASMVLTIVSGVIYTVQSWSLIDFSK